MHEYSIVSALLDRVETEARGRGATVVRHVQVSLGELAGVDPDLLTTAYEVARFHTLCAGAPLTIRPVPARWVCPACDRPIAPGRPLHCTHCRRPARLVSGDEIVLESIDMEVP